MLPDVLVFVCKNSVSDAGRLQAQWTESGVHVQTKVIPCSGKIDAQYILHSLEGGVKGVAVVTCPHGKCTLAQGNYRAEIRIKTVQRLLSEIGDNPQRVEVVNCPENATLETIKAIINECAARIAGQTAAAVAK